MPGAPIRTYWWPEENFGDQLSPRIVAALAGRPVERADPETAELVAVGSVLEQLHDTGFAGTVWGAGLIGVPETTIRIPRARFRAVRGPLTRARLGLPPTVALGDPGLLADRLLAQRPTVTYDVGLVPHKVDLDAPMVGRLAGRSRSITVVDVRAGVDEVLGTIASCRTVLSSALHGLVAADALGVPNAWIELSGDVIGDGFKFRDHLAIFGQGDATPLGPTGEEDPEQLARTVAGYERPGLARVRERLVAAFPFRTEDAVAAGG